jgi:hypothetical protein
MRHQLKLLVILVFEASFPAFGQTSTYEMNERGQTGDLKITRQADGSLSATISNLKTRGCLGSVSTQGRQQGTTIVARAKADMPNSPPCTLRIDVRKDAMVVHEENCVFSHGAACEFSGTYNLVP